MLNTKDFYLKRFSRDENVVRGRVWKILVKNFFQKFVNKKDFVVDLGAGYCEFINNINCSRKVAIDINPDTKKLAGKDVKVILSKASKRQSKIEGKADILFISNFLEHLETKDEVILVLKNANRLLRKGGKLIVLQPNIDLVKEKYWDFIDHKVALNGKSVEEALQICEFELSEEIIRFLPYTSKNKFSIFAPSLLGIYLSLPTFLRFFAGQSLFIAVKK